MLAESSEAIGNGRRICEGVFLCDDEYLLDGLAKYNDTHRDYLLIVNSELLSSIAARNLEYSDFRNAAAVAACDAGFWDHSRSISGHYRGLFGD